MAPVARTISWLPVRPSMVNVSKSDPFPFRSSKVQGNGGRLFEAGVRSTPPPQFSLATAAPLTRIVKEFGPSTLCA
jgi:hypothetical protein